MSEVFISYAWVGESEAIAGNRDFYVKRIRYPLCNIIRYIEDYFEK